MDTIEKDPKYHPFLLNTDVTLSGLSAFRQPGTWASSIGDLVIKVCSDVLCVPIIIISSSTEMNVVPFIPEEIQITVPIYIAFKPGHYDATDNIDTRLKTFDPLASEGKTGFNESCLIKRQF